MMIAELMKKWTLTRWRLQLWMQTDFRVKKKLQPFMIIKKELHTPYLGQYLEICFLIL